MISHKMPLAVGLYISYMMKNTLWHLKATRFIRVAMYLNTYSFYEFLIALLYSYARNISFRNSISNLSITSYLTVWEKAGYTFTQFTPDLILSFKESPLFEAMPICILMLTQIDLSLKPHNSITGPFFVSDQSMSNWFIASLINCFLGTVFYQHWRQNCLIAALHNWKLFSCCWLNTHLQCLRDQSIHGVTQHFPHFCLNTFCWF